MTTIINLIVTCTKKKTRVVPESLHLRDLNTSSCDDRIKEWIGRLDQADEERETVRDLYSGDHWSVARSLHGLQRSNFKVRTWVASAGCGLLGIDEEVQPYSATFSKNHLDSVVKYDVAASEWWSQLTKQRGWSVKALAEKEPHSLILLAASTTYLRAMRQDIVDAAEVLETKDHLSIVSAGTRTLDGLDGHLLPCDARMRSSVGGALRSLNARVAKKVLEGTNGLPLYSHLKTWLQEDLDRQPDLVSFGRTPMENSEIREYVITAITENPGITHSRLLRQFRDDGNACEQGRFRDLFLEVAGKLKRELMASEVPGVLSEEE